MFPFQPNAEFVFGAPTTSEAYQIHDDLILNHGLPEGNLISFGKGGRMSSEVKNFELSRQKQMESRNKVNDRKVMRREVERKRRQDISSLHASLSSLLPLDQIKGKRSICDQIGDAVNHIKQTEKKIAKLKIRRDELKKLMSAPSNHNLSSSRGSDGLLTVNMAADGMEILVSSRNGRSELGLSRLLAVLVERQLNVVSCVSTRTNDKFIHRIKIEATNLGNLDVSELQDRLTDAIN